MVKRIGGTAAGLTVSWQMLAVLGVIQLFACRGPKPEGQSVEPPSVIASAIPGGGVTSANLQLQVSKNACAANQAQDYFKVTNATSAAVSLADITIKYWINDTSGATPTPQVWYGGCVTSANGTCVHPISGVTATPAHFTPACGTDPAHQANWEITISTTDTTPLAVGQSWSNLQTAIALANWANFTPGTATWFSGCGTGKPYAADPAFAVYDQGNLVNQGVAVPSCRTPEVLQIESYIDRNFYTTTDVVSSFLTSHGEPIDCIAFNAQHSVKAWLAQGVTIPPAPPPLPPPANVPPPRVSPDAFNGQPDSNGNPQSCGNGLVPTSRPTVALIQAAGGLDAYLATLTNRSRRLQSAPVPAQDGLEHDCWLSTLMGDGMSGLGTANGMNWDHAVGIQNANWLGSGGKGFSGMEVTMPIYKPLIQVTKVVDTQHLVDHSVSQLWMQTGGCEDWYNSTADVASGDETLNTCKMDAHCHTCSGAACNDCAVQSLEVALLTSGDEDAELDVFFTSDGYFVKTCFVGSGNCSMCPTVDVTLPGATTPTTLGSDCWVEMPNAPFLPGHALTPNMVAGSQYGVEPSEAHINVLSSAVTNPGSPGWWVYYNGTALGWLPPQAYKWPDQSLGPMGNGPATYLQSGGEVLNTWPLGFHTNTAMGSDNNAWAGYKYADYNRNISYFDDTGAAHPASLTFQQETNASELDFGVPGVCGVQAGSWSVMGAQGAYTLATDVPAAADGWGTYFYFGGGASAAEQPAGCQSHRYAPGQIMELTLPAPPAGQFFLQPGPLSIARGPDCNLWVTDGGSLLRVSPTFDLTSFPISGFDPSHGKVQAIATAPDGDLWFGSLRGGTDPVITRFSPPAGFTDFDLTGIAIDPLVITVGPDRNLWLTGQTFKIGKVTTSGTPTAFTTPIAFGLASGTDGNLWFTVRFPVGTNQIGRLSPSGGAPTMFTVPTANSGVGLIAQGNDGNMWFTEVQANQIGKIDRNGQFTEYKVGITAGADLDAIAPGPDGNIWFTEDVANQVGRITPDGVVTEFAIPHQPSQANSLEGITTGPDGNVWFTETTGNRIGRITPP